MVEAQQAYRKILERIRVAGRDPELDGRRVLDRAAGLLAGRVGCRVAEAHVQLTQLAAEQGRDAHEVAAGVLATLESRAAPTVGGPRAAIDEVLRPLRLNTTGPRGTGPVSEPPGGVPVQLVQQVLDSIPGAVAWLAPTRDDAGTVTDYVMAAVSADAVDIAGRSGTQLVGITLSTAYPATAEGPLWQAYEEVLTTGEPRDVGPITYQGHGEGIPAESQISVRARRLGSGLLVTWVRHDDEARYAERVARTERLGNLGWGEWDLVSGDIYWSDQLYRIYDRDPALGPARNDEYAALTLPEDRPLHTDAAAAFARGEAVDITYRLRLNGEVRHLRTVADAVRDAAGQPLRIYGIVQDVTARETARARLADVERQLREQEETLRAEHRLAADLQHIILPIPKEPIDLPGLRVAVRYLPAEQASRVGGDWFHAAPAPDGGILLAVGDVAGHGLAAATTMAQLRHALAALALTTTGEPAELLTQLNKLMCAGQSAATATAVIARYDPLSRQLTWAQAGHPAPLRASRGVTTPMPRPPGMLLGAVPDAEYGTATTTLELQDILLFYTDGLVEHRDHSLAEGLAPVITTLDAVSKRRPEDQPLAALLAQLPPANPNDDTCVVAVRPVP
ncbi:MAG TPA: SpoIIE family protein phosphatase [Pilimelia sp.]|nr:SpoIIE family protein phosphatase [Pilimelia sp.]